MYCCVFNLILSGQLRSVLQMLTYQRFAKRTGYKFPEIESFRVSSLVNFVTVQTGISVEAERRRKQHVVLVVFVLFQPT